MADPITPRQVIGQVDAPSRRRLFHSPSFFRLWLASLVSSFGDWVGFVAIIAMTARISQGSGETAIAFVLSARLLPGFFLGPIAGVLLDRLDRRRMMIVCDIGRAAVFAFLPFVDTVLGLVAASLVLEGLTIAWSSAKEATVPNLVPASALPSANSLSIAAAYGTFPLGSLTFSLLAKVAESLGKIDALSTIRVNQESIALWADGLTFVVSAVLVSTLVLPKRADSAHVAGDTGGTMRDMREGWRFIRSSPRVRAVMLGIGTGLFGGGMLIPLGPIFARQDLGGGAAGFGALITALGLGVAVSVIGLSVVQRHLPHEPVFIGAVFGASACIILGAASASLTPAVLFVGGLGLCAGAVYVLGFTILQTNVDDALRGRTFATLYTLIRICLLLSFTVAPVLSRLFGSLASTVDLNVSGVRLTLWTVGLIIGAAGVLSLLSLRDRASVAPVA